MVQRRRPHRRRLLYQNKAANATLTLTLDRPLGDRGAFLTAAGASLGNGTLVVTGSVTGTGQASDLIQDLITTSGYITGDFADKIINVTSHEQLVFKAYQTYKAGVTHYVLGASLAWFSGTPTSHGNFTLGAGETFDVDVNLTQQIANPAKNWDGRSLTVTASNSSTLILSAGNNLATGTLAVRGGDLVITGSTGVGSGLIGGSADFTTVAPVVTVRDGGYWGVNGALVIGDVSAGGVWYNGGAGLVITGGTVVSASGLFSGAGPVSASVGAGGLWRTTGDLILGTGTSRLSIAGSVSVGGMYRQDYGVNTLTLTLDGPRGAFLTAGSIILGSSGTLRIDGATAVDGGAANFASSGSASALGSGANAQVLLQATAGTISGDFAAVTVGGNAGSTGGGRDFIIVGG
ncbi:MAG: hypothetical protein LBK60_00510, partial [Verrucomicrobiales bacterium]|nr:hypothetical protein [Verrucomicrobiales bacterium]